MEELAKRALQELNPVTAQFKVLTFLAFRGPCSPSSISEESGMPPGTVRPALRGLLDKGFVKQLEDGNYKSLVPFTEIISNLYASK